MRLVAIGDVGQGVEAVFQGFELEAVPVEASRKSFGLASMRERVESLGGELKLDSRPGAGTRVVVSIPFTGGAGRIRSELLASAAR